VDGSARPQIVRREANPLYHDILVDFTRRSGSVNAGEKMHRRAGVKLHHGWTPNAPTARLCCTTNRMRSDCLTGECFRDVEPASPSVLLLPQLIPPAGSSSPSEF
jgi:hypothetical protein